MHTGLIEFISEYCDRWCDRCAFTSRCSVYAIEAALGMCGDVKEAIELAVGGPREVGESAKTPPVTMVEIIELTPEQRRAMELAVKTGVKRIRETPMTQKAMSMAVSMHRWFHTNIAVAESVDAVVREAVQIARWDSTFIGAKLTRALHGRERDVLHDDSDDDPVQSDSNGSAKVALMSIERSALAWQTIAQATGDAAAAGFASGLATLQSEVEEVFPFARLFKRPGFDEP